jgi:WD repeat-containing protein 45
MFSSPPEKISVFETADNPLGLCCLSAKLLAFPGRTPGQVQLVETETGNVTIVPAHSSSLRAIEISPDGELMATASETVNAEFDFIFGDSMADPSLGDTDTRFRNQ